MEDNKNYLRYFIHEELYPLKEEVTGELSEDASNKEQETIQEEALVIQKKEESPATKEVITVSVTPTRHLLVMFEFEESESLPKPLKQLMLKILEAIKCDIKAADYANISHKEIPNPAAYYHHILIFSPTYTVSLPNFQEGKIFALQQCGETKVLQSESLAALDCDNQLKKKLWVALKEMFL